MTALLLDRLAQTVTRASGLTHQVVLETAAQGTVRTTGSYLNVELVQDRANGRVEMYDEAPTLLLRAADAPGTDDGDVALVDGRLHHVRRALEDGTGLLKLSMMKPQRLGATWGPGGASRVGLYLAGGQDPSGRTAVEVGAAIVAIVSADDCLGLAPGATLESVEGQDLLVGAVAAWAPGWARLSLTRTA